MMPGVCVNFLQKHKIEQNYFKKELKWALFQNEP